MITLTKDKIYFSPFSLKNTKPDSDSVKELTMSQAVFNLGDSVEFGEDVTFSAIFDFIIFHKELFNVAFSYEMRELLIDDFIADYKKDFSTIYDNQEYDLRVMWQSNIYKHDGFSDFVDYVVFDAFGKIDKNIDGEKYGISIQLSSLSEIKDKLIIIDNSFNIQNSEGSILKANFRILTLRDVISAILSEITYYGNPEERDETRKELEKRNKEVEGWIEDGTIEERMNSEDDIKDDLNEMMEKSYVDESNMTFWDTLYPKEKPTGESDKESVDNAIIVLSEGSEIPLEQQLQEAHDAEEFEKAAKIIKLIKKRDNKKDKS